jgi:hypothetical protein|tara:strand:+ start:308 stop:643 length:336 start_codon:yes stop_codon:yes gene_type:complete
MFSTPSLHSIAYDVIEYCQVEFDIQSVYVIFSLNEELDCWATCEEDPDTAFSSYRIEVHPKQDLRDFVASLVHEMVHVKQFVTDKWEGDGEEEALNLQYKITDKIWKEGVI